MDNFFGWLDEVVLNFENVKNACFYYLINSPDDKEKNGKELNKLDGFCYGLLCSKTCTVAGLSVVKKKGGGIPENP